jgi:hypothetical protein
MRYGVIVNAGEPAEMAEAAAEAESAGWDAVFYYDAIAIGDTAMYDPWVVLAAMAMRTSRVRLGLILTPPSRRRPWKLARSFRLASEHSTMPGSATSASRRTPGREPSSSMSHSPSSTGSGRVSRSRSTAGGTASDR